jgi:RNA polymerase sigma factor (sigma-70 family)
VRNYDGIRSFLRRRTGDAQVAEELTQEVWLLIAPRAEDPSILNPDAWLRKIAVNLSIDWLRQNSFRSQLTGAHAEGSDALDDTPDVERALQARQSLAFLESLVDELPPRRRAAFLLYRGRGLTVAETAHELGVSTLTAKTQIRDALAFLRRRMIDAGLWP